MTPGDRDALIVVDVQNDFCPGGKLPVPDGDAVVGVLNRLMPTFSHVIGTLDWHPPGHSSFTDQGGIWPEHCVQDTPGAEPHPHLDTSAVQVWARKGGTQGIDGYSGFVDSPLDELLRAREVAGVFVAGLATDYCVKHTALHARERGYPTTVIVDACRAVDVSPGDGERALDELRSAGVRLVRSGDVLGEPSATAQP